MITMKVKAMGIMLLCMILFSGCTGSAYINNSTEQADISRDGETFDVTVDECIAILNEDLKTESLALIPTDYEVVEQEEKCSYRCMINDILMIRFETYKTYGSGIVRIGLSCIDSVTYDKGEKSIYYEATKADWKTAATYYEIICNNVQPRFNGALFFKNDTSERGMEVDGLVFFGNTSSTDTWYGSETIKIYEVFSSDKLYDMYEEELYDDDDIFLYNIE